MAALAGSGAGRAHVEILKEVDSTNTWLMSQRGEGGIDGRVVFAERQRAGRGRRGNPWEMRAFDDLVVSMGFAMPADRRLEGLSLAVGVALREALTEFGMDDVAVKWPNDLIARDRKLAGILIETLSRPDRGFDVVTGIGLNFSSTDDAMRIGALDLVEVPCTRQALAELVCTSVFAALDTFAANGFGAFRKRFPDADFLLGKSVEAHAIRRDQLAVSGIASGVSELGSLLIQTAAGTIEEVNAGDVTLTGQYQQQRGTNR